MEYKLIPLLRYSSLVLLFLAISVRADNDDEDNYNNYNDKNIYALSSTPPIYLGDTDVNVGQPFSISCIISIRDPIHWIKDGELIKKFNNIRHSKDEHAFIEYENNLDEEEGEGDKIEATISVEKALHQHNGKYQCNSLHKNYHLLHVHKYDTKQDFLIRSSTTIKPPLTTTTKITPTKSILNYIISTTINPITTVGYNKTQHKHQDKDEEEEASTNKNNYFEYNLNKYENYYDNDKYSINFPLNNINEDNLDLKMDDIADVDYDKITSPEMKKKNEINNLEILTATNTISKNITNCTTDSSIITLVTPFATITQSTLNDNYVYINTSNDKYLTENNENETLNHILILTSNISNDDIISATVILTTTDSIEIPVNTETLDSIAVAVDKTTDSDILVPNYDNIEQKLKAFEIRSPLVLCCNITTGGDYELSWLKNGTDVSEHSELLNRYTIKKVERQFVIPKTLDSDAGIYTCSVKDLNASKNITVVANVVVKLPQSTAVVEGEKLKINCIVLGTDPEISWKNENYTYTESSGRVTLTEDDNKIPNAVIIVDNIVLEDRGNFTCIAKNMATKYAKYQPAESTTFVRVKGKLAALWPFLGICGEVFILCAIILIYEKRRNNAELDESDTDQSPEQKLDQHGKDTDVRHRK